MIRAVVGSMLRKSLRSVRWASSAIWPKPFDAGRARADDDERHQAVDLGLVGGQLGQLEGAEDATARLEGVVDALHAGSELGEPVVAEVGLPGAGGADQLVLVRGHPRPSTDEVTVRLVDVGDLAEHHAGVLVPANDLARGGRDLALGEDAGGHLVEQRGTGGGRSCRSA